MQHYDYMITDPRLRAEFEVLQKQAAEFAERSGLGYVLALVHPEKRPYVRTNLPSDWLAMVGLSMSMAPPESYLELPERGPES